MNANTPTILPGSFFFFKKKQILQLFLSRSEDVHVIGYDMDFFLNIILTFSQMMDDHGLVGQELTALARYLYWIKN